MPPPPHSIDSEMVSHCFDVQLTQFEQVIESRSATPKPAGQPRNDTDVIRHKLGTRVKCAGAFPYHLVIKFPRFCCGWVPACRA
ncbi:hypothetical protein TBKG_02268 [Mycobacterium tuberculosis '98-R604 INH-RIF-EM']|nr:predicted protein [Mycobacterium tuberculosis T17]EPZ66403.1 hypothetical protein TBKG_02268 [Mycobacterium tuberculosis '98-R604 INH-RIF-EM']